MNSALRQPISDRDNLSAAAPERLMSNDRGSIRFRLAKISAQVSAFFQVKSQVEASRHRQFRQRGPSQDHATVVITDGQSYRMKPELGQFSAHPSR